MCWLFCFCVFVFVMVLVLFLLFCFLLWVCVCLVGFFKCRRPHKVKKTLRTKIIKRSTCAVLSCVKKATGEYVNVCYRGKAAEVGDIYWPSGTRIAAIAVSIPAHNLSSSVTYFMNCYSFLSATPKTAFHAQVKT